MDVVTYALAKKMVSSVASGITEIETNGTTIRFKTTSGDWFTVTLNSINEVSVSANGHLIVKLSDGTQIDCGALPVGTMDSSLSTISENGVQNKVITNALNGKQNTLVQGSGITIDTTDPTHPQISANIDYTNLINKPTKLSDFTNDENFITNTANNLSNYYLKTETYTQSEVNDLISQLASLSVKIVESLPTTDISTTTIYLINVSGTNNYNQWMYINNAWANIGSTSVDLTNYYTKTQVDTLLNDKVDKISGKGLSTNDFTNAYKSTLDNYTVDSTLDSTSTNPIQNAVVTQALDAKQPKTLSSPITIGGTSQTTVEGALGGLNSLCGTKLTMVTSLPLSPSNQETVLYIGNSSGGLLCGGIYQYQVSEWVMISNVSSFTFNSDEFAVDSTTNEVSLKPSYADIPSFLPNNVSSSNKLATTNSTLKTIQLSGSVDCNTLTEPGLYTASASAVSALTNAPVNSQVQLDGGFSILVTKTNVDSVYYGMQMFIPYGSDVPFIRKSYYLNEQYWSAWGNIITSNNIGSQTVASANKIEPNYTSVALTNVTSGTLKYIKLADCHWNDAGTLQVYLGGDSFQDTLVINFGGGSASTPMLCGYYSGNSKKVYSVITRNGSTWDSIYSIYVKISQMTDCTVRVSLLKGTCEINITESTTAPTNISEWTTNYGLFGNITSPNITSLEERVTALESKL